MWSRPATGGSLPAGRRPRGRGGRPLAAAGRASPRRAAGARAGSTRFEDFANRLDGLRLARAAPGRRAGLVPRRPHPALPPPALRRRAGRRERSGALAAGRRGGARQDGRGLPDPQPPAAHRPRRAHAGRRPRDPDRAVAGRAVAQVPPGLRPARREAPGRRRARLRRRTSTPSTCTAARSSGSRPWSRARGSPSRRWRRGSTSWWSTRRTTCGGRPGIRATPPTARWRRSPPSAGTSCC